MRINTPASVTQPSGATVKSVREAIYLGGLVSCDGRAGLEISRRLWESGRLFDKLHALWKHSSVTLKRKLEIYRVIVQSKLLYSLESLWLLQAERRRLDAFHYRCLRRSLGIPSAYISRVPNADVLQKADVAVLSDMLMKCQVKAYRKICLMPNDSLINKLVCDPAGLPMNWADTRQRGRPRQRWSLSVYRLFSDG